MSNIETKKEALTSHNLNGDGELLNSDACIVYLVEHRTGEGDSMNTVVATVVSSIDNAIKFMEENTDFDDGDKWWWAVYPMILDEDTSLDELYLYNKKVERIYWQNKFYGKPVELGLVYEFDLNFGDYNYLGDYSFRGKLVNTENEELTFEEVDLFREHNYISSIGTNVFKLEDLHGIYEV